MHIPFCKQACTYCNFHFATSLRYKDDLLRSISSEAVAEQGYLGDEKVDSIYFGGGTPSLLTLEETATLLDVIRKNYKVDPAAEITFEANPDESRQVILNGLKDIKKVRDVNPNAILVVSFFDAKGKELANIFSDGNIQIRRQAYDIITAIDPSNRTTYEKMLQN